jgi:hypothetical protein
MNNVFRHTFFFVIACLSYFGMYGQQMKKAENQDSILPLKDLQGDWRCYYIKCEKICEICCSDPVYVDVRMQGDTVYSFNYPHQYYSMARLLPKGSKVNDYRNETGSPPDLVFTSLKNDTLILGGTHYYVRTLFDNKIVARLKKDSINSASLIGDWVLVTRYLGDYGDDNVNIRFPFKLPATLKITSAEIKPPTIKGRYFTMNVNGTEKKFRVRKIDDNRILLSKGRGEGKFYFFYERKDKYTIYPVSIYKPYNLYLFP